MTRAALLLVVIVPSCSHDAAPPAAPARAALDDLEATMRDVIRAIARLERAMIAADHACPEIAAAFRQFASTESAVMADVGASFTKLTATQREQFHERHASEAVRLQGIYDRAMASCPGDGEVGAAIELAHVRPTSWSGELD